MALPPENDPLSLGNLLIASGHCTQGDIDSALTHRDEMMGEYMVRHGIISRDVLEVMLAKQRAARGGNGAIAAFAQLAVDRAKRLGDNLGSLDKLVNEKK